LRITSHDGDGAVVDSAKDSVEKAQEVGLFRYASSTKDSLEKLTKMINSFDHSIEMKPTEIKIIRNMRSSGHLWGSISESLFDKFGNTLSHYSISRRAKKQGIDRKLRG